MKRETKLTRRETLLKLIAGGGALSLAGCGLDARSPAALAVLESAETLTRTRPARAARAAPGAGARISAGGRFRPISGPTARPRPTIPTTRTRSPANFADWRLEVGGLVDNPLKLSLADLRALAVAHPDHPPRLRRGLELHRPVERRSACQRAGGGAAEARRRASSPSSAPTRSNRRSTAPAAITRRSISSTPLIRRPSSPTR